MTYNDINAHVRDSLISFDPARHVYSFENEEFESVTTVVDGSFDKFDADYWAERKSRTPQEKQALIDAWNAKGELARNLGTLMHDRIERYYLGLPDDGCSQDRASYERFLNFAIERPLNPYRTEWRIFSERYRIAGTLDFLARDKNGRFIIYDWKRSTKVVSPDGTIIDSSFGRHAHAPINHLADTVFIHYALQVSIYRFILAEHYGINVDEAFLGVFHPDMPRHYCVALPYLEDEVVTLLRSRLK